MRARNLKPGYFKNERFAALPLSARVLFAGLWCLADREGRLEDSPRRIKAEIFPYENHHVEKLLKALAAEVEPDGKPAFILRYEVNSFRYIQIINFKKHQNPHIKEPPSTIPAPCEPRAEHRASTGPAPGQHGSRPALSPSLNPIPESNSPSRTPAPPSETARTRGGGLGPPPRNGTGTRGQGIIPGQVRDWSDPGAPAWIVAIGRRASQGDELVEAERDALFEWSMGEEPAPVEIARGDA